MSSDAEKRQHEIHRNNAAVFRVLHGKEPTAEDAARFRNLLIEFCAVDDDTATNDMNGVVGLLRRDGMRSVYLKIGKCVAHGAELVRDGGWDTIADSGGETK